MKRLCFHFSLQWRCPRPMPIIQFKCPPRLWLNGNAQRQCQWPNANASDANCPMPMPPMPMAPCHYQGRLNIWWNNNLIIHVIELIGLMTQMTCCQWPAANGPMPMPKANANTQIPTPPMSVAQCHCQGRLITRLSFLISVTSINWIERWSFY